MLLCVTIDTEEDEWGKFDSDTYQCSNIKKIPELQRIFEKYKIIPTYLISYPVAADETSNKIFGEIIERKKCEIGMHCHPWNTPPIEEERNRYNSMLCNLPKELIYEKLKSLHETIKSRLGVTAKSFRAGRWGYGTAVAQALDRLGYKVDSSIFPFTDWSVEYGPDYSNIGPKPYRFHTENIYESNDKGEMAEIPATVGFISNNLSRSVKIDKILNNSLLRKIRMRGILRKFKIHKKIYLSPETNNAKEMIEISNYFIKKNIRILNLFFHSTSLREGLSPFVRSSKKAEIFLKNLEVYFQFTSLMKVQSVSLSEACNLIFENGHL